MYYTEFGYQMNLPDPFAGVPPNVQDAFLQLSGYIAWRTPRVQGLNQFRLTDGAVGRGPRAFEEFQSGLIFRDGRLKPAYEHFRAPFIVTRTRGAGGGFASGATRGPSAPPRRSGVERATRGRRFRVVATRKDVPLRLLHRRPPRPGRALPLQLRRLPCAGPLRQRARSLRLPPRGAALAESPCKFSCRGTLSVRGSA